MRTNGFDAFPEPWGELALLLREAHERLEQAGAAGAGTAELAALSRSARRVVRDANDDPERAVARAVRVVREARELAGRAARRGRSGDVEALRHSGMRPGDIGREPLAVLPSCAMSSTGSTTRTGGHQ